MQCKTCFKMFTPTAKKIITEICDQCNERISQNDSKNIKKSFDNTTLESEKYYKKQMDAIDMQIKNIGQIPNYALDKSSNFENQEKPLSTVERLKKCQNDIDIEKITKSSLLKKLKKKYPHPSGRWGYADRNERQYGQLVSTKELNVAEFVLKWEFEHQHRIPDMLARRLLTERIYFEKISNGFLDKMSNEYD